MDNTTSGVTGVSKTIFSLINATLMIASLRLLHLQKSIYIYFLLTCFLCRNSLTTIYSKTIISSSSGMSCRSSVSKIPAEFSLNSISHQSTRAYFKGKAYIKIIHKNHARSYYLGNTVRTFRMYWANMVWIVKSSIENKINATKSNIRKYFQSQRKIVDANGDEFCKRNNHTYSLREVKVTVAMFAVLFSCHAKAVELPAFKLFQMEKFGK